MMIQYVLTKAEWVRKYPVQLVAYSARTASAVAARLAPAGIRVEPIDGLDENFAAAPV